MKKPKEYYTFVRNSIAIGFAEAAYDTLSVLKKAIIIICAVISGMLVIYALIQFSADREAAIRYIITAGVLFVFILLLNPLIQLTGSIYNNAAKNRAQAFYDLTGNAPGGWTINDGEEEQEEEEATETYQNSYYSNTQSTHQGNTYQQQQSQQQYQNQNQQQFNQQQAYAQYAEHVASAEQKLNEQKRKLEQEWARLQAEKRQYEQQKVSQQRAAASAQQAGDLFAGCTDEDSRKKRYRELLKIYHPDNQNGDKTMVEEVNRQFERRKR